LGNLGAKLKFFAPMSSVGNLPLWENCDSPGLF